MLFPKQKLYSIASLRNNPEDLLNISAAFPVTSSGSWFHVCFSSTANKTKHTHTETHAHHADLNKATICVLSAIPEEVLPIEDLVWKRYF